MLIVARELLPSYSVNGTFQYGKSEAIRIDVVLGGIGDTVAQHSGLLTHRTQSTTGRDGFSPTGKLHLAARQSSFQIRVYSHSFAVRATETD